MVQQPLIRWVGAQVSGADGAGQWREAVEEVKRFRAAGGLPNTVAYNALVRLAVPEQDRMVAPLPAGVRACTRSQHLAVTRNQAFRPFM